MLKPKQHQFRSALVLKAELAAQDALDKFEIAQQYKSHIQAVTEDRHLEEGFEAGYNPPLS